jgi:hypothetical protein
VWEATSVRIVASKSELQDSDVLPVLGILGSKFKLTQDGNKSHLLVELLDDQNTPMGHNIVSSMPGMDRSKVHIRVNDSLLSGMISQVGPSLSLSPFRAQGNSPLKPTRVEDGTNIPSIAFSRGWIDGRAVAEALGVCVCVRASV